MQSMGSVADSLLVISFGEVVIRKLAKKESGFY